MNEIASKTFASQFVATSALTTTSALMTDPFQRLVVAIKNNRIDLLAAADPETLKHKDENGKNLLFYAVYQKCPLPLLYLLRAGLPYDQLDTEHKNLIHFCAYSGSHLCLNTLHTFIKLAHIQQLNKKFLDILSDSNYKRTDAKEGKLKHPASPKRMEVFGQMQKELTELYRSYLLKYEEKVMFEPLSQLDEQHQRNPFHLVCLNRYQKCLTTLEEMILHVYQPNFCISDRTLEYYTATDAFFKDKLDPRLYIDTLDQISNFILPDQLEKIHHDYETSTKKKLTSLLVTKDKDEYTPLYLASRNGSTAMINMLKKYEPETKQEEKEQIMKIASNSLARSHIIDLCEAAKLPDTKPLNFLLSCGDEINGKKTIFGTFALLESIKAFSVQGSVEPIRTLLKNGADINEQDTNGWTVLHHAAHLGQKEVVELLLKYPEISPNKMTNKRYHALHLAAISDFPDIIHSLIQNEQHKFDVNVRDWDGMTPLLHAAKKGSMRAMQALLELKADIYAVDKFKMTALHHAAFSEHHACLKEMLHRDSDEDKLIHMRNSKGKLAKDLCSNTAVFDNIFTAARTGNINVIRKQIAAKASVKDSTTPIHNRTPLILAVMAGCLPSVRFLIESGADTYHEDEQQKSAASYCDYLLLKAKSEKKVEQVKKFQQIKALVE